MKDGVLRLEEADSVGLWVNQYAIQPPSLSKMYIKAFPISQGHGCL